MLHNAQLGVLPPGNPGNYSAPTPISSLKHEKFPPNVFLFLSFKETICCGFKEGESFSSQLFCYKFCILQWFSFFLPWKMQNYQRNYQEFDFPPMAPTSNVLASLNCFFIGSHEKNHRKVVARAERKVFGKMPLIVCLLSAATQWALL